MGEHPLDESLWRRGWRDTKVGWTSWQFVILDVVGGGVVGLVFEWGWGLGLILFGVFCVWVCATARAPIKQRDEARRLIPQSATKRLIVQYDGKIYETGDGCRWLRLRVENPTALPIHNCYGKLLDRRLVSYPCIIEKELTQVEVSPEAGRRSSEHQELPPEGHRFPWLPTQLPETTRTISGHNGHDYLYIVAKRKQTGCFGFPNEMGIKYANWSIGDFELEIEIGSESEAEVFQPTRVRITFSGTESDIEFLRLEAIN